MRLSLASSDSFTGFDVDVTAGQEVKTADATEKENAEAEISENTDETEIYVGFSDSEETE